MAAPRHAKEHEGLMQIVGKLVKKSELIKGAILITVGMDDRPMVGANMADPAMVMTILRQLAEAEDMIEQVVKVGLPRDN